MIKLRKKLIIKSMLVVFLVLTIFAYMRFTQSQSTVNLLALILTSTLALGGLYLNHKVNPMFKGSKPNDTFVTFNEDERTNLIDKEARLKVNIITFNLYILIFFILTLAQVSSLSLQIVILLWALIEVAKEVIYYFVIDHLYKQ